MRVAVLGFGVMVLVAAGCGAERSQQVAAKSAPAPAAPKPRPTPAAAKPKPVAPRCSATTERSLTSARASYAGFAPNGAVAYRTPGGALIARFGRENVNGYPTYFGVLGKRVGKDCRALWYRVQLPLRPNGSIGWVRASAIELQPVDLRIEVDVSRRELTLFRAGKRQFSPAGRRAAPSRFTARMSPGRSVTRSRTAVSGSRTTPSCASSRSSRRGRR